MYREMKATEDYVNITPYLIAALKDCQTLVHHLPENPKPVQLLFSEYPSYLHYTDTWQLGVGGVIVLVLHIIQPWVWKYVWPQYIINNPVTYTNPKGRLTINNIELAGLVLGWLVLEYVMEDLMFKHVTIHKQFHGDKD